MWQPVKEPWQYRVLDMNPPSLDVAALAESLKLTPTQRLENVQRLNALAIELQRATRDAAKTK